jgi:hypothetical protein
LGRLDARRAVYCYLLLTIVDELRDAAQLVRPGVDGSVLGPVRVYRGEVN